MSSAKKNLKGQKAENKEPENTSDEKKSLIDIENSEPLTSDQEEVDQSVENEIEPKKEEQENPTDVKEEDVTDDIFTEEDPPLTDFVKTEPSDIEEIEETNPEDLKEEVSEEEKWQLNDLVKTEPPDIEEIEGTNPEDFKEEVTGAEATTSDIEEKANEMEESPGADEIKTDTEEAKEKVEVADQLESLETIEDTEQLESSQTVEDAEQQEDLETVNDTEVDLEIEEPTQKNGEDDEGRSGEETVATVNSETPIVEDYLELAEKEKDTQKGFKLCPADIAFRLNKYKNLINALEKNLTVLQSEMQQLKKPSKPPCTAKCSLPADCPAKTLCPAAPPQGPQEPQRPLPLPQLGPMRIMGPCVHPSIPKCVNMCPMHTGPPPKSRNSGNATQRVTGDFPDLSKVVREDTKRRRITEIRRLKISDNQGLLIFVKETKMPKERVSKEQRKSKAEETQSNEADEPERYPTTPTAKNSLVDESNSEDGDNMITMG